MPNFEKFSRQARPVGEQAYITVQKRGTFGLNRAAFEYLDRPEYVALLFDRDAQIIGFQSTTKDDPDAYPIRAQKSGGSFIVAGQAFCVYYKINTDVARRYLGEYENGTLMIDLNSPSTDVSGPRTKHNAQVVA